VTEIILSEGEIAAILREYGDEFRGIAGVTRKTSLPFFFVREKSLGRLARAADENRMADFCIATIQGAMLMGRITRSSHVVETMAREALAHLKGYRTDSKRV